MILEDNDGVILMILKNRYPMLRHLPRTHKIDVDFLFDILRRDPGLQLKYVPTRLQIADILTKGAFTGALWERMLTLMQILPPTKHKSNDSNNTEQQPSPNDDTQCSAKPEAICFRAVATHASPCPSKAEAERKRRLQMQ